MGDYSSMMDSTFHDPLDDWKNSRLFTASVLSYPVELFIFMIEREGRNNPSTTSCNLASQAWRLIADIDSGTPAGMWKSKMSETYLDGRPWERMKEDLLDAFGRLNTHYSLEEKLDLISSLTKGTYESFKMYLLRIEWVLLEAIGEMSKEELVKMFFLSGLEHADRACALEKLGPKAETGNISFLVSSLDSLVQKEPSLLLKQEAEMLGEENIDFDPVIKVERLKSEDLNDETLEPCFEEEDKPLKKRAIKTEVPIKRAPAMKKKGRKTIYKAIEHDLPLENESENEDADYKPYYDQGVPPEKRKKRGPEKKDFSERTCETCGETIEGKSTYEKHIKLNCRYVTSTDRPGCLSCGISGPDMSQEEWDRHETKFHLGRCQLCKKTFTDLEAMRNHHISTHKGLQMSCATCGASKRYQNVAHKCTKILKTKQKKKRIRRAEVPIRKEESNQLMTESTKAHEWLRTYELKDGETAATVKKLTSHLYRVDNREGELVTTWFCGYCREQFGSQSEITQHTKSFHDNLKYQCDMCPDSKPWRKQHLGPVVQHKLRKHGILTESFILYSCDICHKFKTVARNELDRHIQLLHLSTEESNTCKVCNKVFKSPQIVKMHIETVHMKLEKYCCPICDEKFVTQHQMEVHRDKIHDGLTEWMCNLCGAKLASRHQYNAHMKRHSMSEVKCEKCGKIYKNQTTLNIHDKVVHQVAKKWVCTLCPNQVYTRKSCLNTHMMYYHIKVRPYVCTTCGREFYKRTKCGQHIAFDHGNWPREKADKEWKFYLRENPHMIQVNSITEEINQLLSLPPEATEEYKATQGKTCRKGRKPDWQPL